MMLAPRLRSWAEKIRRTPLHPQWLHRGPRFFLPELEQLPSGTLLDIGCGDQWLRHRLALGVDYVSLDYPPIGAHRYGSRPLVFGDAQALPIRDGTLDGIAMLEVIEHLPDPDAALAEAWRVLRPGGSLVLSAPFAYPLHDQPYDYRRFTKHGLVWLLKRHGFEVRGIRPVGGSLSAAVLSLNLAIAATCLAAVRRSNWALLLAIAGALLVLVFNAVTWLAERVLPEPELLSSGYAAVARRPH